MKSITKPELQQISDHLIQKPFKYDEVFQEVLDHYASAYEQLDKPLSEVMEELDQEFLNSRIVKMNDQFKNEVIEKLETAHFNIFIRHFRWPQIVSTLSIIGLLFLVSQFIQPLNWLKSILIYSVAAIPLFFVVYFGTKILRKKELIPWTLENVHFRYIFTIFNISFIYLQLCSLTYRFLKADGKTLLDYSPIVTTCVLFLGFLLLSTTVQLVVKKIRSAIA
jgi:hypothetical protein